MNAPHLDSQISTRVMQAYGAACIVKFCAAKSISSEDVTALVEHLLNVLTSSNLQDWEVSGTRLSLSGRGDPLPKELVRRMPPSLLEPLHHLVECVVEIGLIDMHGAVTSGPVKFLERVRALLAPSSVEPPSIAELIALTGASEPGWGQPLSLVEYRKAREWCMSQNV